MLSSKSAGPQGFPRSLTVVESVTGSDRRQPRVAFTQSRKCATAVAVKCPCGEPKKSNACCACGISA